jgi:hypothetical protein
LQNLLHTLLAYGQIAARLGLLIFGAYILARERANVGLSEGVTGLRTRLIGLGATEIGFVLLLFPTAA